MIRKMSYRYIPHCLFCNSQSIEVRTRAAVPLRGARVHTDHWDLDMNELQLMGQLTYHCRSCGQESTDISRLVSWQENAEFGVYVPLKSEIALQQAGYNPVRVKRRLQVPALLPDEARKILGDSVKITAY